MWDPPVDVGDVERGESKQLVVYPLQGLYHQWVPDSLEGGSYMRNQLRG